MFAPPKTYPLVIYNRQDPCASYNNIDSEHVDILGMALSVQGIIGSNL